MISSSGSGRSTHSVTCEISRTGRPSYELATPSARIRSATASHAPPMVAACRVCGSSRASPPVTTAWYALGLRVDLGLVPGRGDDVPVEQAHNDIAEDDCSGHYLGRLHRRRTGPRRNQSGRDVVDKPGHRTAEASEFDQPGSQD